MHDGRIVGWSDLQGGVNPARGGATDQQWYFQPFTHHFPGDMNHFVQRWRDQTAQADDVDVAFARCGQDFFGRHHDTQIDHFIVVAGHHNTDDVLTDVVHVSFHGCQQHFPLRCCLRGVPFRFHVWNQISNCFLHDTRTLDDLRKEHLAGAKEVTHHVHSVH